MKATDIERARDLLAQIELDLRVAGELKAGAPLKLTAGKGSDEQAIVLSAGFQDELRQRLIEAFAARVNAARDEAGRLGVEL